MLRFFISLILFLQMYNVHARTPHWVVEAGNISNCIMATPDMGSITVKEGRWIVCMQYYNETFTQAFCDWLVDKIMTPTNKRNVAYHCRPYRPKPEPLNELYRQQLIEQGLIPPESSENQSSNVEGSESFNPDEDSIYN